MRILMLANIPFDGLRRRQQQIALGLSARGHDVVYVEPPRPLRALLDPARFEPDDVLPEKETPGAGERAGTVERAPAAGTRGNLPVPSGVEMRCPQAGLTVLRKGVGMVKMGAWGWAARAGWKMWARQVRELLAASTGAPAGGAARWHPQVTLVYHPALIPAAREMLSTPIVFECLDDYPSLAPSAAIGEAYDAALQVGLPLVGGFLAVNRYLVESWGRFLEPSVPQRVVEHGVDLSLFQPPTESARSRGRQAAGLTADAPVAGYLGRFDARASYEDLQRMLAVEPRLRLLLLGEVSAEGAVIIERLARERVRHIGPLRHEQAAALLVAADLLLLPLRREPHLEAIRGLKLYEYLATGLPVLASFRRGVKAFREVLYLYSDLDELDAGLRAALSEPADAPLRAARVSIARESGWDRRVAEIEAFLMEVAGAGART